VDPGGHVAAVRLALVTGGGSSRRRHAHRHGQLRLRQSREVLRDRLSRVHDLLRTSRGLDHRLAVRRGVQPRRTDPWGLPARFAGSSAEALPSAATGHGPAAVKQAPSARHGLEAGRRPTYLMRCWQTVAGIRAHLRPVHLGEAPLDVGLLAQLAEQRTFNPRVQGSIPWRPTVSMQVKAPLCAQRQWVGASLAATPAATLMGAAYFVWSSCSGLTTQC